MLPRGFCNRVFFGEISFVHYQVKRVCDRDGDED